MFPQSSDGLGVFGRENSERARWVETQARAFVCHSGAEGRKRRPGVPLAIDFCVTVLWNIDKYFQFIRGPRLLFFRLPKYVFLNPPHRFLDCWFFPYGG